MMKSYVLMGCMAMLLAGWGQLGHAESVTAVETASFKDVMVRQTGFRKMTEGILAQVEQRLAILQNCEQQRKFWDGTTCVSVFNLVNPVVNVTRRNVEVWTFLYSGGCCRRRWGVCRSTWKYARISCSEPPSITYAIDTATNDIAVHSVECDPRIVQSCPAN